MGTINIIYRICFTMQDSFSFLGVRATLPAQAPLVQWNGRHCLTFYHSNDPMWISVDAKPIHGLSLLQQKYLIFVIDMCLLILLTYISESVTNENLSLHSLSLYYGECSQRFSGLYWLQLFSVPREKIVVPTCRLNRWIPCRMGVP